MMDQSEETDSVLPRYGFTAQKVIDDGRTAWQDVEELKKWLSTQDFPKLTDEQVVVFLLSCDNDHEATKKTIEAFYYSKTNAPELFNDRNLERPDLQKQILTLDYVVFPKRLQDGSVIIYHKLFDHYYANYNMEPAMVLYFMMADVALYENPPTGMIILFDMKGVGLMHLTRIKLGALKKFLYFVQEGVPMQLKAIHVLNVVYFIDKVMAILKPFMKKELYNLLHFHPPSMDMKDFFKIIPKECLPEDYEGDLPPTRQLHEATIQRMRELKPFFDAEERQRHSAYSKNNNSS